MKKTKWVVRDNRSGDVLATFDTEAEVDVYLRLARWGGSFWPTLRRYSLLLAVLAAVLIYHILT